MKNNLLTKKILDYEDLVRSLPGASNERLIDVRTYDNTIVAQYEKQDMLIYTGETILIRDALAKKLAIINQELRKYGYGLKVVYGYRHPTVQEQYFNRRLKELRHEHPDLEKEALVKYTHNFVAVPDVAGHPTGGAVDLTIIDKNGVELDMGTAIADYAEPEKIQTYAEKLSSLQKKNRNLLHDLMIDQGFAPFYGEWWHFSYGDR